MDDRPTIERTGLCCSVSTSTKPSPLSSSSSAENLPSDSGIRDFRRESVISHGLDGYLSSSSDSSSVSEEARSSIEPSASPPQLNATCWDWCQHDDQDGHGCHDRVSNDELLELSRILGLKNLKCVHNEGGRNVLIGFD